MSTENETVPADRSGVLLGPSWFHRHSCGGSEIYADSATQKPLAVFEREADCDRAIACVNLMPEMIAIIDQLCRDVNQAHDELCKLQGIDPATHDWPAWSPQANTIRWAEKTLGKRLGKPNAQPSDAKGEHHAS